jgi:hypothetical protein
MQVKNLKTTIPEPLSSKGKKVLIHAKYSSDSSQSVTSHAQQNNEQSPVLSEVQPHASNQPSNENINSTNRARKGNKQWEETNCFS